MIRRGLILLGVVVLSLVRSPCHAADGAPPPPERMTFDDKGAKVGEQLPNLPLYDLQSNEKTGLREIGGRQPTLLVTCSYTCPKSRKNLPDVVAVQTLFGKAGQVAIIYVIEAHPKGDPSPYRGVEDVTDQNRRDRILCRQPTTFDERLKLAREFKDKLHVEAPIYVDEMDNAVWRQLGGGPNMAVLVNGDGIVVERQGWFDRPTLDAAVRKIVEKGRRQRQNDAEFAELAMSRKLEQAGFDGTHLRNLAQSDLRDGMRALLRRFPEVIRYTDAWSPRGNSGGRTLLQYAAASDSTGGANELLRAGADVNGQNEHNPAPLAIAAGQGKAKMVRFLLDNGADVNLKSAAGSTALDEASFNGDEKIVEMLREAGAKPDLFTAAAAGDLDFLKQALVDDPSAALRLDGHDRSALDYAANVGRLDSTKLLLDFGVKDFAFEWPRDQAIHYAIAGKHVEEVRLLLENGADVNAAGFGAETPLEAALYANSPELVKLLLDSKADPAKLDMGGMAALHHAARDDANLPLTRLLVARGASVDVASAPDGRPCGLFGEHYRLTPLHVAAESKSLQTVRFLLQSGAYVNAEASDGETPADLAEDPAVRRLLVEHGGKLKKTPPAEDGGPPPGEK